MKRGEEDIVAAPLMDTVCGLLLEFGEFSAVDVLRASGLLAQLEEAAPDAEAWSSLGDPSDVRKLLREAEDVAARLGLEVTESDAGAQPTPDGPELDAQLDLFVDSARALAIQAVREALVARDVALARRARERLAGRMGEHRSVAQAGALIAALEAPPITGPADAAARLALLEYEWLRAASALLGREGRAFLAPLWRNVARALEDIPFDPARPELHASRAWARCGDYEAVVRTVRATPGHDSNPALLATLAEAHHALDARTQAMECWFALCRLDPKAFERRIFLPGFPDRAMARAWREAQNSDALDEDLAPAWFPAWLLIAEPTLARSLPEAVANDDPSRAFNVLRALRREDGARRVELRAELRALHRGLFRAYMATLES